jgi:hypothetical protein
MDPRFRDSDHHPYDYGAQPAISALRLHIYDIKKRYLFNLERFGAMTGFAGMTRRDRFTGPM